MVLRASREWSTCSCAVGGTCVRTSRGGALLRLRRELRVQLAYGGGAGRRSPLHFPSYFSHARLHALGISQLKYPLVHAFNLPVLLMRLVLQTLHLLGLLLRIRFVVLPLQPPRLPLCNAVTRVCGRGTESYLHHTLISHTPPLPPAASRTCATCYNNTLREGRLVLLPQLRDVLRDILGQRRADVGLQGECLR